MGGLAHYLEAEGIATTQISLIREHTGKIRPPRALWVPFELGRPLGAPNDPIFQRRVVLATLDLLAATEGPVLVDFPDEASPVVSEESHETAVWAACPVHLASSAAEGTDLDKMVSVFRREVAELRPWYDIGFQHRGRPAVGDFDPRSASELFIDFIQGNITKLQEGNQSLPVALRLASHDLKSFYFEAIIAQPGASAPDSATFNHWFLERNRSRTGSHRDSEKMPCGNGQLTPVDRNSASGSHE